MGERLSSAPSMSLLPTTMPAPSASRSPAASMNGTSWKSMSKLTMKSPRPVSMPVFMA